MCDNIGMNEKKNVFIGSIVAYFTIFVEILLSILFTPYLLKQLGDVDYGIRSFCTSLVSYLNLLTIGISGAYFRFRKLEENKDETRVKKINGLFLFCFLIIGAIAIICGTIFLILLNTKVITFSKFPAERHDAINIVLLIMIIQMAVHFPFALATIITSYNRKFIFKNLINLLNTLLFPALTLFYILLGFGGDLLIVVTIISFIVSLSIDIIKTLYIVIKLKEKATLKLDRNDFTILKPMLVYCAIMFVSSAVSIIHNATDQIILGLSISAVSITLYSLSFSFSSYLTTASTTISGLLGPKITNDAIDNKMETVQKTCDLTWNVLTIILGLIVGGFAACGKEFVSAWVGVEKSEIYYYSLALFTVNLMSTGVTLAYTIHTALNKHKFAAIIYLSSLCFNIILSFILCKYIGIWGVIIPTIISKLFEAIALTAYTQSKIKISLKIYWLSLLKNLLIAGVCFAVVFFSFKYINITEHHFYVQTLIKGSIFLVLYTLSVFIIDKKFIKNFFVLLKNR